MHITKWDYELCANKLTWKKTSSAQTLGTSGKHGISHNIRVHPRKDSLTDG